jgi:PAS domain-containing protein
MSILQQEVEVILARHFAECLAMPVFIVDPNGNLLFYNEPAEIILGQRFEETGAMPADEWGTVFSPLDDDGSPLALDHLPLMIALEKKRPAHRYMLIKGLNGIPRRIGVTAFPIIGQANRFLGAIAIFWEETGDDSD